jgi:hypothetical protein
MLTVAVPAASEKEITVEGAFEAAEVVKSMGIAEVTSPMTSKTVIVSIVVLFIFPFSFQIGYFLSRRPLRSALFEKDGTEALKMIAPQALPANPSLSLDAKSSKREYLTKQYLTFSAPAMNHTFQSIGVILGLTIGGLVLYLYANNFQLLMTIFGISSIALAPIVLLLTKDPTRHLPPTDPFIGKSTRDDIQLGRVRSGRDLEAQ